jgi:hypothetical protein
MPSHRLRGQDEGGVFIPLSCMDCHSRGTIANCGDGP